MLSMTVRSAGQVGLDALLQVHKQEATEGFAVVTVYSAVALGLLAYLGARRRISMPVRISLCVAFGVFALLNLSALRGTAALHSAIHEEISQRVRVDPFVVSTASLRRELRGLGPHNIAQMVCAHIFFDLLIIGGILLIGGDSLWEQIKARRRPTSRAQPTDGQSPDRPVT